MLVTPRSLWFLILYCNGVYGPFSLQSPGGRSMIRPFHSFVREQTCLIEKCQYINKQAQYTRVCFFTHPPNLTEDCNYYLQIQHFVQPTADAVFLEECLKNDPGNMISNILCINHLHISPRITSHTSVIVHPFYFPYQDWCCIGTWP